MEDSHDDYQRRESETHRLDRHWNELLQELRVTQTAAQIIGGFLFTLPFQQRFASLDTWDKALYLGLVLLAAATTIITLLPVAVHRRVFRRHQRGSLVGLADRASKTVLVLLPLLVAGTLTFTVDVVAGRTAATASGGRPSRSSDTDASVASQRRAPSTSRTAGSGSKTPS